LVSRRGENSLVRDTDYTTTESVLKDKHACLIASGSSICTYREADESETPVTVIVNWTAALKKK
jgi:hypothetical protein